MLDEASLSAARALQFAGTLVLFGSALFYATTPPLAPASVRRLWRWLAALGIGAALAWLLAEAHALTGSFASWPEVLTATRLGQVLALRAGLLAIALVACGTLRDTRRLCVLLSALGGLASASFAWSGHGTIGAGHDAAVHLCADVLHLLAAGVWIGALVSLSALISRASSAHDSSATARVVLGLSRFSAIGPAVVSILIATGLVNSWYLIGPRHWRALLTSAYGLALVAKILLFMAMAALAAVNRYQAAPALQRAIARADADTALRRLRATLFIESALALGVIAIVAALGTLEPPNA